MSRGAYGHLQRLTMPDVTDDKGVRMGDKGGKKDKEKNKQQQVTKHKQEEQTKHDKAPVSRRPE
jgi:hypothetical protein